MLLHPPNYCETTMIVKSIPAYTLLKAILVHLGGIFSPCTMSSFNQLFKYYVTSFDKLRTMAMKMGYILEYFHTIDTAILTLIVRLVI